MNWVDYYARYQRFALSMQQSKLVAIVASRSLERFPENLPPSWRETLITSFEKLAADLFKAASDARAALARATADDRANAGSEQVPSPQHATSTPAEPGASSVHPSSDSAHPSSDLIFASFAMIANSTHLDLDRPPDFAPLVFGQQLTMSFAHISAFVADSVRAICYARPAVLKNERKIDWKTVIEAGEWNSLMRRIIDEYVFTFGWDSIRKCVLAMRDRLGLQVDVADEVLERIDEGELLRNVVIHDSGRASSEYLKRTRRTDVTLGEQLLIEPAFVQTISHDLLMLGGEVLLAVSESHFGRKRESITGVWRSGPKK